MFKDNPNVIKLDKEIYLYPNFISQEESQEIINFLSKSNENLYLKIKKNQWFNNKSTKDIENLKYIYYRLQKILGPDYDLLPTLQITRLKSGESMYVHSDTPGEGNIDKVTSDDPYCTGHVIQYGIVVYINEDYEGGEIYYPNRNIIYKPNLGDLVIHSAFEEYKHGVKEVTSGTRYVYTNSIFNKGKAEVPKW